MARPRPYRDPCGNWVDDVWGFRCNGDVSMYEAFAELIRAEDEARVDEARALFYAAIVDQLEEEND